MSRLSAEQRREWDDNRRRQALLGTSIASWVRSRGDHLRRLNTGIALRTYQSIASSLQVSR